MAPLGTARKRITDAFREGGIDRARVEFVTRRPRPDYLALYQQDPGHYPEVLARYRQWLAQARVVAVLRPVPGKQGGPTIYIAAARGAPG